MLATQLFKPKFSAHKIMTQTSTIWGNQRWAVCM